MRILVVSNLYPPAALGGYERGCGQMVSALRARGHDVRVLTSSPRVPLEEPAELGEDVVRALRIVSELFFPERMRTLGLLQRRQAEASGNFLDASNVYALSRQVDEFQPDVAYIWNLHGIGGLGLFAALQYRGVPWVCHLKDAMPMFLCQLDWRRVAPLAEQVAKELEGRWIACSQRVVHEIERFGPAIDGPLELVPGWTNDFEPPPVVQGYRNGEPLRLIYTGAVVAFKGVGTIIEALGLLSAEGMTAVTLDLVGQILEPRLQEEAAALGLGDRVRFHGPVSHEAVLDMFLESHLFVFATHEREPFGIAPLEAAARGVVPLIAENCGIAEWLVDGVHCLKAPPSAAGFASAVKRVINEEVVLAPIARRARSAATRDFHIRRFAPRVDTILTEAAATGTGIRGSTMVIHRAALTVEHTVTEAIEEIQA